MNDIEWRVRKVLKGMEGLEIDIDALKSDENLIEMGVNSFTGIKIIIELETEFDVEFQDEDINEEIFKSIDSLKNYIEEKLKETIES